MVTCLRLYALLDHNAEWSFLEYLSFSFFKSLFRKCDEMIFDQWKTCAVMQVLDTDVPGTVHDDTQQHILYEL